MFSGIHDGMEKPTQVVMFGAQRKPHDASPHGGSPESSFSNGLTQLPFEMN